MSAPAISCAFPPGVETPEHIALAERLGFARAWCYDSPALYGDVWMVLGRAAALTERIGLGPGVLVPSLRHPMVTAAAVATLEAWAPGRVSVAVGSGFTGRMAMGVPPMRWADVEAYVVALRALLRGGETEWDGATLRMLQDPAFGADRPLDVPVVIGADGPKGMAVAERLGDGVVSPIPARVAAATGFDRRMLLAWGTVLEPGETPTSPRAKAATAPGLAVVYHATYGRGPEAVDGLPGGAAFRGRVDAIDPDRRHLALHEGHFVRPNSVDGYPDAAFEAMVPKVSVTGEPDEVRAKLARFAEQGITEVAYQPIGPDVERELTAFAEAALA